MISLVFTSSVRCSTNRTRTITSAAPTGEQKEDGQGEGEARNQQGTGLISSGMVSYICYLKRVERQINFYEVHTVIQDVEVDLGFSNVGPLSHVV